MTVILFFLGALLLTCIDWRHQIIPDLIVIPLIIVLILSKYVDQTLLISDGIALLIIVTIFVIPIAFNLEFGGGDVRFGAYCALFLGIGKIGYFVICAGLLHLLLLWIIRKKQFGFAPAMTLATFVCWIVP